MSSHPAREKALFATPSVTLEHRADGTMLMRSNLETGKPASSVGQWLEYWARTAPTRTFLAERKSIDQDWLSTSYEQAYLRARAIAGWLLTQGLSADRPLVILSDNSIDHALLALGAMLIGIPVATVSPAYSLMSADHQKLRAMIELLSPGIIYVADTTVFNTALNAISTVHDAQVIASQGSGHNALAFAALSVDGSSAAVELARATVRPETIARFLFTSGSTGSPKAVINTHRMLTASQAAKAAVWPFLAATPPIIVDWLPWSHTFGANHNFNLVLSNGGSLYIDAGRPAPHLAGITAANIKEVRPNICFNVPRGYDMLVSALKVDSALRERFFGHVKVIFYAAAALQQSTWEALHSLSMQTIGQPTPMVCAWGATETSPLATDCHFQAERSGNIGVPVPGVVLKLLPNADKLEVRVRGAHVTPGYWRDPEKTKAAFDDEGFYSIGDAVRLADLIRPEKGLFFDGRIAEDFKLSSGTFVNVGQIRLDGLAALAPIAQDIVVAGHDTDMVAFLVFPNLPSCREVSGLDDKASTRAVLNHPAVRAAVAVGLAVLKERGGGSSRFATRARLLTEPANVDAGEITDKGYINQRAVLKHRPDELAMLLGRDTHAFVALADGHQ